MIRAGTRAQVREILRRLDPLYAGLTTGLNFANPFELLVATILSAQCTDERVNSVTPVLFTRYRGPDELSHADPQVVEEIVHPLGFFRNKTRSIQSASAAVMGKFGGEVPDTMQDLLQLPGVARKTANVVLTHAFNKNEGIAVDTHVYRLSHRLGLSREQDPVKVEARLMRLTERSDWGRLSDVLIWHGRRVCVARSPRCPECVLLDICPTGRRCVPARGSG